MSLVPDNYVCNICGISGHLVKDCPNYLCHICEIRGHLVNNCPKVEESITALQREQICRFHDPYAAKPNCEPSRCYGFKHPTKDEFELFCKTTLQNNPRKLKEIAEEYYKSQNLSCSMFIYIELLDKYPNNAAYTSGYARILEEFGDHENAEKYHLKSINVSPIDDRFHRYYAGFLHEKRGKLDLARKYFMNALKLNPSSPSSHCQFGLLLEDLKQYKEAEQHYLKSIELTKAHLNATYHLALMYHYRLVNLTKSQHYFEKLLSFKYNKRRWWFHEKRTYTQHYYEYGLLLKDIGATNESLDNFNIALEKVFYDDDRANIYYDIGRVYDDHLNDINAAKWYFNAAKDLNPKQYTTFYDEFIAYHVKYFNTKQNNNTQHMDQNEHKANNYDNSNDGLKAKKDPSTNIYKSDNVQKVCQQNNTNEYKHNSTSNIEKSESQIEFQRYLKRINLTEFHNKFVKNECDDLKYFEVFDDEFLKETIQMKDVVTRKYFLKEITKFLDKKLRFDGWLKQIHLEFYLDSFHKRGIFTLSMFHHKIKTKSDLFAVIGNSKEADANMLWHSTEKQTRKLLNKDVNSSFCELNLEGSSQKK